MPSTKAVAADITKYSVKGSNFTEQSKGQGQSWEVGLWDWRDSYTLRGFSCQGNNVALKSTRAQRPEKEDGSGGKTNQNRGLQRGMETRFSAQAGLTPM